jgi:hypothetical protein
MGSKRASAAAWTNGRSRELADMMRAAGLPM